MRKMSESSVTQNVVINGHPNFGILVNEEHQPICMTSDLKLVPVYHNVPSNGTNLVQSGVYLIETLNENDEVDKAKKEIRAMLADRSRRLKAATELTKTPKASSGPPTVQSSPLTPTRRERLQHVRQVLFAKNLTNALKKVTQNSVDDASVTSINLTHVSKNITSQCHDGEKENVPENEADLYCGEELMDENAEDLGNLLNEDVSFFPNEDDRTALQSLITYACENEMHLELDEMTLPNNQEKEEGDIIIKVLDVFDDPDEGSVMPHYVNPKTGKREPPWFERPALTSKFSHVIRSREVFRYVLFILAQRLKDVCETRTEAKRIRKLLKMLGYNHQQLSVCFNIARSIITRSKNRKFASGIKDFTNLLKTPGLAKTVDEIMAELFK